MSDVANGFQLWSERYDRELKDIFDVQDEIAKAIAERLRVTLVGGKDDRLVEQATTNIEAYQLYLRGRALVDRRGANVPAGLDLLRAAVALDPGYSLAWAGIADALTVLAYGTGAARGSDSKEQAMAAANRAIETRSHIGGGPHVFGVCDPAVREQPPNGEADVRASVGTQPTLRDGPLLVRAVLLELGVRGLRAGPRGDPPKRSKSIRYPRTSRCPSGSVCLPRDGWTKRSTPAGGPLSWTPNPSCRAGRSASRLAWLDDSKRRSPRWIRPPRCRDATSLALTGLAGVFGQRGNRADAFVLHRELMDRASRSYVSPSHLALTAEAAGQHEEAIAFARRAWDDREPSFIIWARHFPQYRTLHSDPRFAAILREMDS